MKNLAFATVLIGIATNSLAGNNFIEFRQFEKVQQVSVAAGALYACSKDESLPWPKRSAYQFLHFKLDQVVSDYFKISYRVIAVQDIKLPEKVAIVDEHRAVEQKVNPLQEAGYDAVQKGEMNCEDAAAFASEVMKYQD